jgi:UDP-2-acetamido-2,6-beta-L-arabino-hexul-4-ose reductase
VRDNPYGRSKRAAEQVLERYAASSGARVAILRLWNVFGKFARPNYNSAVATFCHNIARGLPIEISDRAAPVRLVHVDDVMTALLARDRPGDTQQIGAGVNAAAHYAGGVPFQWPLASPPLHA